MLGKAVNAYSLPYAHDGLFHPGKAVTRAAQHGRLPTVGRRVLQLGKVMSELCIADIEFDPARVRKCLETRAAPRA